MTLDAHAVFAFGDGEALKSFMLAHRFVHAQEAVAITEKFHVPSTTFGLGGSLAEDAWVELMQAGERQPTPPVLKDWLQLHADIHTQAYSLLGSTPTTAPDLSIVDFSDPREFYDWMTAHQQMHDYEQAALGLT